MGGRTSRQVISPSDPLSTGVPARVFDGCRGNHGTPPSYTLLVGTERDGWLGWADTAKQLAFVEDVAPPTAPASPPPKKVALAALKMAKSAQAPSDEERPDSAIREIPAALSPADPRAEPEPTTDPDSVPPLDVAIDLD